MSTQNSARARGRAGTSATRHPRRRHPVTMAVIAVTGMLALTLTTVATAPASLAAKSTSTSISLSLSKTSVAVGEKVTVSGTVKSGKKPVKRVTVKVQQLTKGSSVYTTIAKAKTTKKGAFSAKVVIKASGKLRVVYSGSGKHKAARSKAKSVKATATFTGVTFSGLSAGNNVDEGKNITVSGAVSKYLKGRHVRLQLRTYNPSTFQWEWKNVNGVGANIAKTGRFSFVFHTNGGGDFAYRLSTDDGVAYLGGDSRSSTIYSWAWYNLYTYTSGGQNVFGNNPYGFGLQNLNYLYFAPTASYGANSASTTGTVAGVDYKGSLNLWHLVSGDVTTFVEWTLPAGKCTRFASPAAGPATGSDLTRIEASLLVNGVAVEGGTYQRGDTEPWAYHGPITTLRLQARTTVAQGSGFGYPEFVIGNARVYCQP